MLASAVVLRHFSLFVIRNVSIYLMFEQLKQAAISVFRGRLKYSQILAVVPSARKPWSSTPGLAPMDKNLGRSRSKGY